MRSESNSIKAKDNDIGSVIDVTGLIKEIVINGLTIEVEE